MQFSQIIGYNAIKKKLFKLFKANQIPQVQLIKGPVGSPILPFALAITTYLHCTEKKEQKACGLCNNCEKMAKYCHPNVYFFFPTYHQKKSNLASDAQDIATWRKALTENPYQSLQEWSHSLGYPSKQLQISTAQIENIITFLHTHPAQGAYKTVLLWLPEQIQASAAHKLLKTLEEPPKDSYIFLVSHNHSNILPTLSSRTWPLSIPPFQNDDLAQALTTKYPSITLEKKEAIIKQAEGNLLHAYQLASKNKDKAFETFAQWLRNLYTDQWDAIVASAEHFAKTNPYEQKSWIHHALYLMHTTLRTQQIPHKPPPHDNPQNTFCYKLGQTISFEQLTYIINTLEAMHAKLARNANAKLLFITTSLAIAHKFKSTRKK